MEPIHSTVLPNLEDQKCTRPTWQCSPPKERTTTQSSICVSGRSGAQKGESKSARNNPFNHGDLSGPWRGQPATAPQASQSLNRPVRLSSLFFYGSWRS